MYVGVAILYYDIELPRLVRRPLRNHLGMFR